MGFEAQELAFFYHVPGGGGLVFKMCPALCNPMDYSLLGSPVCGISQARGLGQVAISSSRSLPEPGIESGLLRLLHLQADSLPLCHVGSPATL